MKFFAITDFIERIQRKKKKEEKTQENKGTTQYEMI